MERLPTFDDVPLDEVLDMRRALDRHLVRFRAGLMKLSAGVESNPWSTDFISDVEDWVHRQVEPSIIEIEEAVGANRVKAKVTRALVEKPSAYLTTSGMSLLLAQTHVIPQIVSAVVGISAGAGISAFDTIRAWQQRTKEIESGALFLYYRLRQQTQ
jgi:hypothetical protein